MNRRSWTIGLLGALVVLFSICSCVGDSDGNEPPAPPAKSDSDTDARIQELEAKLAKAKENDPNNYYRHWVSHFPLKAAMRDMWVNCGHIIQNSDAAAEPEVDWLLNPALQVSKRAREFEDYWQNIHDLNRAGTIAAMKGDWVTPSKSWDKIHHECRECHDVTWSKMARAMTADTLKGWIEKDSPFGTAWGDQVFMGTGSVRATMKKLQGAMGGTSDGISNEDLETYKASTLVINNVSEKNLKFWKTIRENADAIVAKARVGDFNVGGEYRAMTAGCRDCHKASGDGRALDPMPWPTDG